MKKGSLGGGSLSYFVSFFSVFADGLGREDDVVGQIV